MAIQRCKNGHYYNDSETPNCPYCSGESSIGKTIPLGEEVNYPKSDFDETELLTNNPGGIPETRPLDPTQGSGNFSQTVMIDDAKNSEIKPVRGWLVVIEGQKLGLDFRVHTGKNSIGRLKSNDICINFDESISGEKSCFVIYDEKNNAFHQMEADKTVHVENAHFLTLHRHEALLFFYPIPNSSVQNIRQQK